MREVITKIPGIKAKHAIITPGCIQGRGIDGAVEEALQRIRGELLACIEGWKDHPCNFHVVCTVERGQ